MIRQAAVAGTFYPGDPKQLHHSVCELLEHAENSDIIPKALIVPHAGYIYSGAIAASVYCLLKKLKDKITRVILIGPSHRVAFKGLACTQADQFMTPLGTVNVDTDLIKEIMRFSGVNYLEQAHSYEHCLEVQLPFLQEVLSDFTIVPIVTGDASPSLVSEVLSCLWGGDETLVVISSDLSHYHQYEVAKKKDAKTSQQIEKLQFKNLSHDAACGKVAISGLLKYLRDHKLKIKTLDLKNSGDTAGDKDRVVGYGAYVVQ